MTQAPPLLPTQIHVAPTTAAGTMSATVAPTTSDGPALVAMTVYVIGAPGVAVDDPSVLVMERSARSAIVSVSLAVLSLGSGSVTPTGTATVTVLVTAAVVDASMDNTTENVADAPA